MPVLRQEEYKRDGKEKKTRHGAKTTAGLGDTKRMCHWFYSMCILRSLRKDMQSRCFQKVSDQDHTQHILQCVDTGTDGTEVGQSISDAFGPSRDEPSRRIRHRKIPASAVLLQQQKLTGLSDAFITIICYVS